MKKVFCFGLLIAAMMMVAFPSCKKEKKVTGVTLSETSKTILVGQEFVLTAVVAPADAVNKNVSWESDKTSVATVDDNGKVKGVAEGEANITVKTADGGKTATCKVTVTKKAIAVTGVSLNVTEKKLKMGSEFTLTATIEPEEATNKEVTWVSDKPTIATVDANGKVKGVALGEATITVTTKDGNKTATCKVTVVDKIQTDVFAFNYIGNSGVPGKHFYEIMLMDKGMISGGKVVKDGNLYNITICSDAPQSATNVAPRMGKYTMGAANQFEPMLIVKHNQFTYTGKIVNGKLVKPLIPFTEGELDLATNKISFKGKDSNGDEYELVFADSYTVKDAIFGDEPGTATTITKTGNEGKITVRNAAGGKKPFILATDADADGMAVFAFFFETADATKLDGVYNVSDSREAKTVLKSAGMSGSSVTYSFYSKLTSEGYVDAPFYFFDSGTVTATATSITFNVTTHFGSTLNFTYIGDMTPKPAGGNAPQRVNAVQSKMPSRVHSLR